MKTRTKDETGDREEGRERQECWNCLFMADKRAEFEECNVLYTSRQKVSHRRGSDERWQHQDKPTHVCFPVI